MTYGRADTLLGAAPVCPQTAPTTAADLHATALEHLQVLLETTDSLEREARVAQLGAAIARWTQARSVRSPEHSYAAWVREHMRKTAPELQQAVRAAAKRAAPVVSRPVGERAIGLEEMAAHHHLPPNELRALLRTAQGRRAFGWPLYLGQGRWSWPARILTDPELLQRRSGWENEPPHPVALPDDHEL